MVRMVLDLDVLRVRLDLEEMLPLLLTLLLPLWVKLAKIFCWLVKMLEKARNQILEVYAMREKD